MAVEMRIAPDDFWRMSPAGFGAALRERRRSAEATRQLDDYRAGVIACAAYNPQRARGTDAMQPHDWFSSLPEPERPRMEDEVLVATWKAFADSLGLKPTVA